MIQNPPAPRSNGSTTPSTQRDYARPGKKSLRFTPEAWAKFQFLRDCGDTEISGFGIATTADPLLITDFQTVKQVATPVTVELDTTAVAEFFEEQLSKGLKHYQFARVHLHTHPGNSALPSDTDEKNLVRSFGNCDWCVMGILAKDGDTYARLRFTAGPGGCVIIPMEVDYSQPFGGSDHKSWLEEYKRNVQDGSRWWSEPPRIQLDQKLVDVYIAAWFDYCRAGNIDPVRAMPLDADDWYDAWLLSDAMKQHGREARELIDAHEDGWLDDAIAAAAEKTADGDASNVTIDAPTSDEITALEEAVYAGS